MAYADLLTTTTSAATLTEGDSLTLTYTMKNTLTSPITLGDATILGDVVITISGPDVTDKITTVELTDATTCAAAEVLNSGDSCFISIRFGTDSPAGETDADSGMDLVATTAFYTPTGGSLTSTQAADVTITVVDPVPEPSALALFSTAVGAVGLLARKRRFPKPRFLK